MDTSGNIAAVLAVVVACLAALAAPAAATPGGTGVVAVFEGNEIDLASGWGDATACLDGGPLRLWNASAPRMNCSSG
jgi:hypothetical protein